MPFFYLSNRNKICFLKEFDPGLARPSLSGEDGFQHLEKSLSPIWKLFYYSGLLFDWCVPIPHQSWKSIAAHCIVIAFCILMYLQQVVLAVLQVMMTIINTKVSLQRIILRVISASNQPLVIITWVHFLLRRGEFQSFFTDWKRFEKGQGGAHLEHDKIKRLCRIIYFFYFACFVGFFFILAAMFSKLDLKLENEFVTQSYPSVLELFWVDIWLRCSLLMTGLLSLTFMLLIEITPALVYYHISKLIKAMEVELKTLIHEGFYQDDGVSIKHESIKSIWYRFEKLRVLLTRADNLFGPILILSHGITFFILCSTVFSLLNMVRQPDDREYIPIFVSSLLFTPARLLFSFVMISKVHEASAALLSTVACLSVQTWRPKSVSFSPNCVIQCFLNRLQNAKLAASPSDFYKIRPSILLTLLGLIVSYTIILLQSNSKPF